MPEPEVPEFYVINLATGDSIPRRGRSGITRSDLLAIDQGDPTSAGRAG